MDDPTLPDISAQVNLIWACDFQEGPLSGLCEVDGQLCWFDCVDWASKGGSKKRFEVRTFQVYRLTPEQQDAERERHLCFIENVGRHFNYVQNRKLLNPDNIRPTRFWRKYTDKYPDHKMYPEHKSRIGVYDANEVIGIFYEKSLPKKKPVVAQEA